MSLIPRFFDERPFRMMERDLLSPKFYMPNFNQIVPREFFQPWSARPWEDMLRQMEHLSSAMNQLALEGTKISSDNEKFQVNVDVQHFAPDEINVKVGDGFVTVEGKHEEKRDEHGYISRQFVRRYALPQGCLPDTVQSKLSSDGVLTVTAPKVLPLPSSGERIVPITHTGPIRRQIGSSESEQPKVEEAN
ncbi:protein lethal(2)essential for life-like [Colias croceus]|uniref:protein lethal(2)essential for life-like n=1 Tax=Colias crocea TaxID=72248 RepID=UPI001E27A027|nr:protein lethal(2)essential for life-like [Colias croceus]